MKKQGNNQHWRIQSWESSSIDKSLASSALRLALTNPDINNISDSVVQKWIIEAENNPRWKMETPTDISIGAVLERREGLFHFHIDELS